MRLDTELPEDVRKHLPGGGGVGHDEIDVAEARVVVVVVDVDRERRGVDDAGLGADAARARAVHGDEDALAEVAGTPALEPLSLELQEAVLAGERRRAAEEHHDVLPQLAEREARREHRPEGVSVWRLVRRHDEPLVLADGGYDRLHVSLVRHRARAPRA